MAVEEGHTPHNKGGPLRLPEKLPVHKPIIGFIDCVRLHGGSVRDCECKVAGGGWIECPKEARGVLPPAERASERQEWTAKLPPIQLATPFIPFADPEAARAAIMAERSAITDVGFEPKTPEQIRSVVAAERKQFATAIGGRAAGFTGSVCNHCGSTRMVRNGVCETCLDCYQSGECA